MGIGKATFPARRPLYTTQRQVITSRSKCSVTFKIPLIGWFRNWAGVGKGRQTPTGLFPHPSPSSSADLSWKTWPTANWFTCNCWRKSTRWSRGCGIGPRRRPIGRRPHPARPSCGDWQAGRCPGASPPGSPVGRGAAGRNRHRQQRMVNALAGSGGCAHRPPTPTTTRPTVVCRSGLTAEMLGLDPHNVEVVARDLPTLAQLVLVDCPDPDTTEALTAGSTLARLRDSCRTAMCCWSSPRNRNPQRGWKRNLRPRPRRYAGLRANPRRRGRGHSRRLASLLAERFPVGAHLPGRFALGRGRHRTRAGAAR